MLPHYDTVLVSSLIVVVEQTMQNLDQTLSELTVRYIDYTTRINSAVHNPNFA